MIEYTSASATAQSNTDADISTNINNKSSSTIDGNKGDIAERQSITMAQSTQHSANLPKHIAIIMDGNNRYATAKAMPKGQGHVMGKEALDPIVEYCLQSGIEVLTVFAFSSEN